MKILSGLSSIFKSSSKVVNSLASVAKDVTQIPDIVKGVDAAKTAGSFITEIENFIKSLFK